jgi:hypothetical protein
MNSFIERDGASRVLADGVPQLKDADLAVVNLEGVVATGGVQGVEKGRVSGLYFRGRPETLAVLSAAGIDAVSTSNNHSGDYGPQALLQQDRLLDTMGILHPGSGANRREACAPVLLEAKGIRVALFSVDTTQSRYAAGGQSPGNCYLSLNDSGAWRQTFAQQIADARKAVHVIVFYVNWGPNFVTAPITDARNAGRLLIEMGVDAVLGDNAHRIQGVEVVDGRPIIYDAGTLLFNFPAADDSVVWQLTISASGVERAVPVPLISEPGSTRPATGAEATRIIGNITQRSRDLGTTLSNGALTLEPPARDPPTQTPRLTPRASGPPPEPLKDPPAECIAQAVPAADRVAPLRIGPLTLLGLTVDPPALDEPGLLWVESYWRTDAPITNDLWLDPRALPAGGRLQAWDDPHEPCDWEWPVQRWRPGVIYRDRVALRPPDDILHLEGLTALISGGFGGPMKVSMGVADGTHELAVSGVLAQVAIGPSLLLRIALVAAPIGLAGLIGGAWWWRRRASRKVTGSRRG